MVDDDIITCPSGFILFNRMCYFLHTSFVYNRQFAEHACENDAQNSTLVKFASHEWANIIDSMKLLGRTKEDSLLESMYYHLENKLANHSSHNYTRKQWLRMLLGNHNDTDGCVIRYFSRTTGAFSVLHQCANGGHPVCQMPPLGSSFSTVKPSNRTIALPSIFDDDDSLAITRESTTTTTTTRIYNSTSLSICDNCSIEAPVDDALPLNETRKGNQTSGNASAELVADSQRYRYRKYQPLVLILSGPVLALILLVVGISILIYYLQNNRDSYSTRGSINGPPSRRTRRSSTAVTFSDLPNTPTVLFTRTKPTVEVSTELDTLLAHAEETDDRIEIVSPNVTRQYSNGQDKEHFLVVPNWDDIYRRCLRPRPVIRSRLFHSSSIFQTSSSSIRSVSSRLSQNFAWRQVFLVTVLPFFLFSDVFTEQKG